MELGAGPSAVEALKGRGVPGEVSQARVTCRCLMGLGENSEKSKVGRVSIPGGGEGVLEESNGREGKGQSNQRERGVEKIRD
jgi:hypothetical protein